MTEGYVGKAKGAAQILCKRGFTDLTGNLPDGTKLTMNGTSSKDPLTVVVTLDKKASATRILSQCGDFKNEKSQMMFILDLLGVHLDLTQKCHPEISGRGVEYAWGYSKIRFRQDFNNAVANNLRADVKKLLDRDVLITENRIRK